MSISWKVGISGLMETRYITMVGSEIHFHSTFEADLRYLNMEEWMCLRCIVTGAHSIVDANGFCTAKRTPSNALHIFT